MLHLLVPWQHACMHQSSAARGLLSGTASRCTDLSGAHLRQLVPVAVHAIALPGMHCFESGNLDCWLCRQTGPQHKLTYVKDDILASFTKSAPACSWPSWPPLWPGEPDCGGGSAWQPAHLGTASLAQSSGSHAPPCISMSLWTDLVALPTSSQSLTAQRKSAVLSVPV